MCDRAKALLLVYFSTSLGRTDALTRAFGPGCYLLNDIAPHHSLVGVAPAFRQTRSMKSGLTCFTPLPDLTWESSKANGVAQTCKSGRRNFGSADVLRTPSKAYPAGCWKRYLYLAVMTRNIHPSILRGGSDNPMPEPGPKVEIVNKAAGSLDDDDDDEEEPPSRMVFLCVAGILAACVSAISVVAQQGQGISTFLTMRQELFALALASLTAGYQICIWLALYARTRMESASADTTAAIFMQGVVKYGSLAVAATCLLGSLGVNINGLTAALTSCGIAIGLASQRVLENLAAGIMLMVFRNFQVGDIVQVAGKVGVVCKITLMATRIDTFSNVRTSIPNKDIFASIVENYSRNSMRRAEIEIATAGSSDIETVRKTLEDVCKRFPSIPYKCTDSFSSAHTLYTPHTCEHYNSPAV